MTETLAERVEGLPLNEEAITLISEALRFAIWAAGEGLSPCEGEPAESPEEFLYQYGLASGVVDYDSIPARIAAAIRATEGNDV